jgi:5-methyltetrahydrofolate--homocysteine methyltransferase
MQVILKEKKLTAKGIYGIFPANQVNDDDIELTENGKALQTFLTLRQQSQKKTRGAKYCLVGLYCSKRFW